jgi:hypothetical protein
MATGREVAISYTTPLGVADCQRAAKRQSQDSFLLSSQQLNLLWKGLLGARSQPGL